MYTSYLLQKNGLNMFQKNFIRHFSTKHKPILITGAGPTGLVSALWLTKCGIPCRIIDKTSSPGESSRALGLHARTLEFYYLLGISDEIQSKCITAEKLVIFKNKKEVSSISIIDGGKGLSPFPKTMNFFPQDTHEAMLQDFLGKMGVQVERNTELTGFTQNEDGVVATLKTGKGTETYEASYLYGCDGAHSTVRHLTGIGFPGGTYSALFFVADVAASNMHGGPVHAFLSTLDFCLVTPIVYGQSYRVIGVFPATDKKKIEYDDIISVISKLTNLKVDKINWYSTYHSHHRVAEKFRKGRAFLLGDAGHVHSPAGGQGMNTGIGDAVNLSWKIASVLKGQNDPVILDTYEVERMAFANLLVSRTDKVFQIMSSQSLFGKFYRLFFLPAFAPLMGSSKYMGKKVFNAVSQINIKYPKSPLSVGVVGKVHAGERLPWVQFDGASGGTNFQNLKTLQWQVHVYGQASEKLQSILKKYNLQLQTYPWSQNFENTRLTKDAFYLVRPDGHVGLVASMQDTAQLEEYLTKFKFNL